MASEVSPYSTILCFVGQKQQVTLSRGGQKQQNGGHCVICPVLCMKKDLTEGARLSLCCHLDFSATLALWIPLKEMGPLLVLRPEEKDFCGFITFGFKMVRKIPHIWG